MFDIKTPTHRNTPLTANHTFQGHVDDNGFRSSAGREEWESDDWRQTYQGAFFQDSLHSRGEYLWDHYNLRWNYEGHFYSDNKEGYGRVSYPEGGLFEGLFADNRRFGPGVFTQPDGRQDVGLWRGPRLVRLSAVVDGVPRLGTSLEAKVRLLRYRTLVPIKEDVQNVAREVLESLTDKETVLEGSGRLYSPLVRNERSLFFDKALHDSLYFGRDCGDEDITVESEAQDEASETNVLSAEGENASGVTRPTKTVAATHLLAWNNGEQMKRLLRHVFRHRHFEVTLSYNMEWVVAGHRRRFSLPGDHEDACLDLLSCCLDGRIQTMAEVLNTADINPDVTDARGNSGLMYAASVDCHEAIDMLLDHGADVNLVNDEGFTPLSLCMMRILAVLKDVKDWGKAFLQRKDYKKAETGAEWRQRASYSQLNANKSQNSAGRHIGISSTEEQTGSREAVTVPAVNQEYVLSLTPRPVPPPEKGRKGQKLQKGAKKSVKIVLSSHSEENSTLESRRAPNLDLIRETIAHLLRRGASPGASEVVCPTLEMAVHARDVVLVELLLSHGADSNALNETGLTPLHVVGLITPSRELVEICELLLRYHADPNLGAQEEVDRDSQVGILGERRTTDLVVGRKTPLHAICMRTDASLEGKEFLESLCRVLLEKGEADASITYLGHCPLSLALLRGHKDLARALLASGRVDPNQALGRDLGVPLALLLSPHCAELHDSAALVEMCDILFEFGADPLKIFSACADEFRGNVLEWGYREMGALLREEKGKKGGQPKKKGRDKTKQLMAVIDRLKDLGRSCLVRHIQGNLVQTLLTAIRQGSEKGTKEVKKWLTISDAARCLQSLIEDEVTKVSREEAHHVMTAVARGRGDQVKGHLYHLFGPEESEVDLLQGAEKDVSESSVESPKKERPLDRGFVQKKFDLQLSSSSTEIQQVKDSPFVVPPELDTNIEKYRVCFECLGKSEKVLLKCPKCKMIYFCSEECNLANDERSTKHGCQTLFYNEERDKYDEGDSDETGSTEDSDYDSDMVIKGDTDEDSNKEEMKRKGKSKRIETDDEDSSKEDKKRRRRRGKKGETDGEDSEEEDKKKGRKKGKKGETDDEDLEEEDKKRRRKKGKIGETDNEDSDSKRVRRKGKKEERDDEDSDKEYKKRGRRKGKKGETDDEDSDKEDKKKGRRKGKKGETDDEDLEEEDKKKGRKKGKKGETDDEDLDKEDKKRGRRKGKKGETDDEDLDKRRRKKGKKGETDDEDSDKEDKKKGRSKGKKGETDDEDSEKEDKKKRRKKGKKGETDDEDSDKEDKKKRRKKGKKGETDDEDFDKEDKKKGRRKGKKGETDDEDSENDMKSKRNKKKRDRTEEDKRRKGHKDDRKRAQKQKDSIGERRRKTKMRDESEDGSRKRKDESREKSKRDKRGESKGDRRRKPEKHEGDKKSKEKHRQKRDTKEEKYKDKDSESDHATTSDRRDKSKGRQKKDKTKSERSKKKDKEDGSETERGRNRVKEKGERSEGQKRGPIKKDGKIQKPGLEKKRPERDAGKSRERRPGEYKGAERKKERSPSGTRKVEEGPDYSAAKPKDPKLGFPDKYEEFMLQVAGSSGWGHDLEGLILPYTVFRNGNFYYRLYGPTPKFVENYSLL